MRVLIVAGGSHGDILPFIGLGREFQRKGHDVRFYANEYFGSLAEEADLSFRAVGTSERYLAALQHPDLNSRWRSLKFIAGLIDSERGELRDAMTPDIVPGETIIVNSTLAFGARSLAEIHDVPIATVHLQPVGFRAVSRGALRPLTTLMWYLLDKLVLDRTLGAALNRRRIDAGLSAIDRPFDHWIHDSDALVGFFPDWYAPPQKGWPSHLCLAGFPLYDSHSVSLPAEVERFLAQGEPPIAFTTGTATAIAHDFFSISAQACERAGKRGILLTHRAEQIPEKLPQGVAHFTYAPFSALLPRVSAFVHHGGIGTASQALRAGVPQLIRPMAHDQFDNADRCVRLGVAMKISSRDYRVDRVVKSLERLTNDSIVRERCDEVAANCRDDAIAAACTHILEVLGPCSGGKV